MLICFPSKEPKQLTPLLTFLSPRLLTTSESGPTRSLPTLEKAPGRREVRFSAVVFCMVCSLKPEAVETNLSTILIKYTTLQQCDSNGFHFLLSDTSGQFEALLIFAYYNSTSIIKKNCFEPSKEGVRV